MATDVRDGYQNALDWASENLRLTCEALESLKNFQSPPISTKNESDSHGN